MCVDSYNTTVTLANNIIAGNYPNGVYQKEQALPGTVVFRYCNLYNNSGTDYEPPLTDQTGTNGSISVDPLFASPTEGDFHLRSQGGRWQSAMMAWVFDTVSSPCIDAGDPASGLANEALPNGGRINMGAYGNTAEASKTPNRPPTMPTTLALAAPPPYRTTDDLVAAVSGSTDPDGDEVTYVCEWVKSTDSGGSWDPVLRAPVLPASMTTKGELWKLTACATDGKVQSEWSEGSPVEIVNTSPTAPVVVTLNRTLAGGDENVVPTAGGTTDADGDAITYRYQWRKRVDGGAWGLWLSLGSVLSDFDTAIGEECQVRARAYDGTANSAWVEGPTCKITSIFASVSPSGTNVPRAATFSVLFPWQMNQTSIEGRAGPGRERGHCQHLQRQPDHHQPDVSSAGAGDHHQPAGRWRSCLSRR